MQILEISNNDKTITRYEQLEIVKDSYGRKEVSVYTASGYEKGNLPDVGHYVSLINEYNDSIGSYINNMRKEENFQAEFLNTLHKPTIFGTSIVASLGAFITMVIALIAGFIPVALISLGASGIIGLLAKTCYDNIKIEKDYIKKELKLKKLLKQSLKEIDKSIEQTRKKKRLTEKPKPNKKKNFDFVIEEPAFYREVVKTEDDKVMALKINIR